MMKTTSIARTNLQVSRIAYGCMKIGGGWGSEPITAQTCKEAMAVVRAALEEGIDFFDHADIYCRGKSEEVFSTLWEEAPRLRSKIFLQSKCGIRFGDDPAAGAPPRYDFSYEHILHSVENSLKRLRTDYLDVLLLHRPDPLVEPEEVAKAFDELHDSGKVRCFGVSNHTAAQITLLQKFVIQPLVINQVAFNAIHTHLLDEGIVFNQDRPAKVVRNEGTIEYCRLIGITVQAWGSLAWGRLTGRKDVNLSESETRAAAIVAELAKEKGVSGEAILIAWILRHPAHIQPVLGTTRPERVKAACQADGIELSREEWYRLFTAGRGEPLP